MNNRETAGRFTRCWQCATPALQVPAPAPCRPVPPGCRRGWPSPATAFWPQPGRLRVYACLRHYYTAETTKAPVTPRPLLLACNRRLFQRGVDRGELGIQVGTEAVDHGDDRERDSRCNQAVFDGGGAGLILHETRNQVLHR